MTWLWTFRTSGFDSEWFDNTVTKCQHVWHYNDTKTERICGICGGHQIVRIR